LPSRKSAQPEVSRNHVDQFPDVFRNQQLLAESVQALDLVAALIGFQSLAPGPLRKLTGQYGGDQKSEQGDPVLRIGDGKSQNRGEEKVVIGQRGDHRHVDRARQSPRGRDGQNRQQERKSDSRLIYVKQLEADHGDQKVNRRGDRKL
jgi:hypothetical protein